MEILKQRGGRSKFRFFKNESGTAVLEPLKPRNVFLRHTIEKRTAIIQFSKDESTDRIMTSIMVKKTPNPVKIPDLKI
jgi:hypothetical protein